MKSINGFHCDFADSNDVNKCNGEGKITLHHCINSVCVDM